jgi:hypothetical protein
MTQRVRPDERPAEGKAEETEADMFSDQDSQDRGTGHFSSALRDRISLRPEGPALRPGAPRLDDAALARKLTIASEVIRCMVQAMADAGLDGPAMIQQILGSAPRHLRPLFQGVGLAEDGSLDEEGITHNLRSKLPSEQRQLIQHGLIDLLDRALEGCMQSLAAAPADALLGQVVGYERRLGI